MRPEGGKTIRIAGLDDQHVTAGCNGNTRRKHKINPLREPHAIQVERQIRAGVVQFNEFKLVPGRRICTSARSREDDPPARWHCQVRRP